MIRSLRWRMLCSTLILVAGITIASSVALGSRARDQAYAELELRVASQAQGIAQAAGEFLGGALPANRLIAAVDTVGAGNPVTIVDATGRLVHASNNVGADTVNSLELQQALGGTRWQLHRDDPATGATHLHIAVPIKADGALLGALRISTRLDALSDAYWGAVTPTIIIGVSALAALTLFSLLFTATLTRTLRSFADVARRLAAGELHHRTETPYISEADPLALAINDMATALESQVRTTYHERDTFGAAIDSMGDALLLVDEAGDVVVANPAALATFGISVSDAANSRLMQVVRDHELGHLVDAAITDGRRHEAQISYGRDLRPLLVSATPIVRSDGAAVLLIARDLSEVQRLESMRREFVANVSHELRTPLASVKAAVETLQGAAADDPSASAEFLGRINEEVDQMTALIQELLGLATLEAGKAEFSSSPIDIAALVEAAVARARPRALSEDIALQTTIQDHLPLVLADRAAVHRVMQNLLDNALKFTPEDGVIHIDARAVGDVVEVSLTDSGEGILPEHLPHIFERFYKADPSRSSVGTGLGLALAKHTLQALGGSIEAESEPGAGATFRFSLPRAIRPDRPHSPRSP